MKRVLRIQNFLLLGAALCLVSSAILAEELCYPCEKAHEQSDEDHHTHTPGEPGEGDFWTTAIPGDCEGGGEKGCKEDGTTNVTIHKYNCEAVSENSFVHSPLGESDDKSVSDCY